MTNNYFFGMGRRVPVHIRIIAPHSLVVLHLNEPSNMPARKVQIKKKGKKKKRSVSTIGTWRRKKEQNGRKNDVITMGALFGKYIQAPRNRYEQRAGNELRIDGSG